MNTVADKFQGYDISRATVVTQLDYAGTYYKGHMKQPRVKGASVINKMSQRKDPQLPMARQSELYFQSISSFPANQQSPIFPVLERRDIRFKM